MRGLLRDLERRPRWFVLSLAFAIAVLTGYLHRVTGNEIAFYLFYLVPVCLAAWFGGLAPGCILSAVCALLWFAADDASRSPWIYPFVSYWNALIGLDLFLLVSCLLSALRESRLRQDQLAQFVVHDLRSPLANMMVGVDSLQELLHGELGELEEDVLAIIKSSGNRMLMLINALLDLSRLEAGKMPVNLEAVPAKELIEAASEQVELAAQQYAVRLEQCIEGGGNGPVARVDRELAVRVLVNLLSNGMKYSPRDSTVTIRVAPCDDNRVAFSVADQGPGIPKEWAEKVFDKFSQVEARKAGAPVGSGLGLSFCRLAVEAQGGRIWLESEPGQGATVTFTLPAA